MKWNENVITGYLSFPCIPVNHNHISIKNISECEKKPV